jgi:hypothetical protein
MIFSNNEGKTVLEKALDLLNESHEEECFAIKTDIEQNFNSSKYGSQNQTSDWGNESITVYASHLHEELPNEIKTLDFVSDGIKNAIRESSISHCLDPIRQSLINNGENMTSFEKVE